MRTKSVLVWGRARTAKSCTVMQRAALQGAGARRRIVTLALGVAAERNGEKAICCLQAPDPIQGGRLAAQASRGYFGGLVGQSALIK